MAQDPQNQGQEQPQYPGVPPSEQFYSEAPGQEPYPTPPNPYGAPPNPYGVPPNPYGVPPNPYGVPPNPYETPTQQRYDGLYQHYNNQGNADPRYARPGAQSFIPPENHPLPLAQALRELPEQYGNVITKPSAATLAGEMTKASWNMVWVQLLISALLTAVFGYLTTIISPIRYSAAALSVPRTARYLQEFTHIFNFTISFGSLLLVPISFFISVAILNGLAKAFGGQGTFLRHGYTILLWDVPLGVIGSLATAIPVVGGLITFAIIIYRLVLQVLTLKAVHGLSTGKAVSVVALLAGIVFVILCAFIIIVSLAFVSSQGG